uniref:Putative secreted protein n=1 Tax=Rhipicephalus microplus TaxID=6941 RepID=A0A6G5A1C7_RHIMP
MSISLLLVLLRMVSQCRNTVATFWVFWNSGKANAIYSTLYLQRSKKCNRKVYNCLQVKRTSNIHIKWNLVNSILSV